MAKLSNDDFEEFKKALQPKSNVDSETFDKIFENYTTGKKSTLDLPQSKPVEINIPVPAQAIPKDKNKFRFGNVILAILLPLVGIVVGIVWFTKEENRGRAWPMIGISFIAMILWVLIL